MRKHTRSPAHASSCARDSRSTTLPHIRSRSLSEKRRGEEVSLYVLYANANSAEQPGRYSARPSRRFRRDTTHHFLQGPEKRNGSALFRVRPEIAHLPCRDSKQRSSRCFTDRNLMAGLTRQLRLFCSLFLSSIRRERPGAGLRPTIVPGGAKSHRDWRLPLHLKNKYF